MKNFSVNNHMKETGKRNPEIERADANWREAEASVQFALQELGKKYFEAHQDDEEAEHYEQITHIKKCVDLKNLWHQYRLSLEGQTKCEKCGAIITSDSLFCNQCGSSVQGLDFSSLGVGTAMKESTADTAVCRGCGRPLVPGASFCEVCGAKV